MELFTKSQIPKQLNRVVKITQRQVSYFIDEGIVKPDIANPTGRGRVKYHSTDNLIDFAIARTLEDSGFKLKAIKKIMDVNRQTFRHRYSEAKNHYLYMVIVDPNTSKMKIYPVKDLHEEYAKRYLKDTENVGIVKLDMRKARSYFVFNVDTIINKVLKSI